MAATNHISGPKQAGAFRMKKRPGKPIIQQGNILIPDISGFTNFVGKTDLSIGNVITQRLLMAVMECNSLDLQISEVEGDALLLYKYGRKLTPDEILLQYEEMLQSFETEIALISEELGIHLDLSLKLIAHYGSISEYKMFSFQKLYGQSIIEAHALLKNSVDSKTYVLMTSELLEQETASMSDGARMSFSGNKECDIYGENKNLGFQVFNYENQWPRVRIFDTSLN